MPSNERKQLSQLSRDELLADIVRSSKPASTMRVLTFLKPMQEVCNVPADGVPPPQRTNRSVASRK